jgi:hypothetical protein
MDYKLESKAHELEAHELAAINSNSASDGCHLHPHPLKPLKSAQSSSGFK